MASLMYVDRACIRRQVIESGIARATYGFTTGQLSDLDWSDPTEPADIARNKARTLCEAGGLVEVGLHEPVTRVKGGYKVQAWAWVSDAGASIPQYMDDADDMAERFVAAAHHPLVEFDGDAQVSLSSAEGAFVCGWVIVSDTPPGTAGST